MSKGYIYCINHNNKYYKIGRSYNSPENRLSGMQVGNPITLRIEWMFKCEDYENLEKAIHYNFKAKNVRGEWFELSDSDMLEVYEFIFSQIGSDVTQRYAKEVYNEMMSYGHVASKSYIENINGLFVINDIQNKKVYKLHNLSMWIINKYSVKEAIIDLGLIYKN